MARTVSAMAAPTSSATAITPGVPDGTCPDGSPPVQTHMWLPHKGCNSCPLISVLGCARGTTFSYQNVRVITPILPADAPDLLGVASVSVTASGIPELTISAASAEVIDVQP